MPSPAKLIPLTEYANTASLATFPNLVSKSLSRMLGTFLLHIMRAAAVGGGTLWGATLPGPAHANFSRHGGVSATATHQTAIAYAALSNNNWIISVDVSPRTGTVSMTAGSKTVTGSGTAFTTELRIGQELRINGEQKFITAIASTTSLTVDVAAVATVAGATCNLINDLLMPTTDFTVSSVGGNALITLSAAAKLPVGSTMNVMFVTPESLFTFADATTQFVEREITPNNGACQVLWYVADATATPSLTSVYVEALGE